MSIRTIRQSPFFARSLARSFGFSAVAALVLSACALTPDTGTQPESLPKAAPRVTGVRQEADDSHSRLLRNFGGVYHAPAAQQMLDRTIARILPETDQPERTYRVTILNTPLINAFALPTGDVYVTRGLLALANDTSEIGGVLAHEVAHVTASHAMAREELEKRTDLISRVNTQILKDQAGSETLRRNSRNTIAGFSREQELEADRIGIRTVARAGLDPYGSVRFLQTLDRNNRLAQSGSRTSANATNFLATHPATPQRIALALQTAREMSAPGSSNPDRQPYLAAIDGIAYGDDPKDGVIRGRDFRHPRLGIAFTAPAGFTLDNTPQAVLGIAAGGDLALRLDAVKLGRSEPLDTFLSSGWIDGVTIENSALLTVNGLPAAKGLARGKDWMFYLGAVRIEDSVYRLIIASRERSPQVEENFLAALSSLHRLTPQEARAIKPQRIRIVTAAAGDTPETMAQRMIVSDRPLDRFLTLNGLDSGAALVPGAAYKIIGE